MGRCSGISEDIGCGHFWCRVCKQKCDPFRNYCQHCGAFHPTKMEKFMEGFALAQARNRNRLADKEKR